MRRLLLLVALILFLAMLSGCTITASGRQGQNSETIHVQTCQQATTVGQGSCNASVWKLGGGN